MRNTTFKHMDKYAIKRLLLEIGQNRLNRECEQKRLPLPKRVRMFYLEQNANCTLLKYKYQQGERVIMKVDEFELPEAGWIRTQQL
ncbi:hypothetical protein [Flagellimonas algicola]|nr:hypothetical protein [Allomuricauda algicola]